MNKGYGGCYVSQASREIPVTRLVQQIQALAYLQK